jgi:putative membrane protein
MKKLIYPVLGLVMALSLQSCIDNGRAKYYNEKTLVDDLGFSLIKNGLEGGLTEIAASQLAVKSSTNPQVVSLAKTIIDDHTKADSTLKWMESDKLITEKDTISGEHQEMIDSLAKKTGAEFDKAYLEMMVKGHEEAVDLFTEASDDKNETIKTFAANTLPTIQMHLDKAKELAGSVK